MNNGIKPTRLWHLTGKKHLASILKNKEDALPRPLSSRRMKDTLQLYGVLLTAVAALWYSFGKMSPPPDLTKMKKPLKNPCEPPPPKKCTGKPGPCPPPPKERKPQICPDCNEEIIHKCVNPRRFML